MLFRSSAWFAWFYSAITTCHSEERRNPRQQLIVTWVLMISLTSFYRVSLFNPLFFSWNHHFGRHASRHGPHPSRLYQVCIMLICIYYITLAYFSLAKRTPSALNNYFTPFLEMIYDFTGFILFATVGGLVLENYKHNIKEMSGNEAGISLGVYIHLTQYWQVAVKCDTFFISKFQALCLVNSIIYLIDASLAIRQGIEAWEKNGRLLMNLFFLFLYK